MLIVGVAVGWCVRVEHSLPAEEPFRDYRRFAAEIRGLAPAPAAVVFFQIEAHALAFHVGRPLSVVVEWEELQARIVAGQAELIVMPPDCIAQWQARLQGVWLREVLRNTDFTADGKHERPLVLMRAGTESSVCPTSLSSHRSPANR